MRHLILGAIAVTALIGTQAFAQDLGDPSQALADARASAEKRDFQGAFDTLQPHLQDTLDNEIAWEIAAEMGRAAFHCARYNQALAILRKVVAARPVVIEPALYLGASSYILGDRAQALAVLEAVLSSGTVDLYRAVTLPGEKAFLADPEVREILDRYSRPLTLDLEQGTCLNIALGTPRIEVMERLGADTDAKGSIAARAGPRLIWIWTFDEDDTLVEVVLHPEHLMRYTPYRVHIGDTPSTGTTPTDILAVLGPPSRSTPGEDGTLILSWVHERANLDLVFARPQNGREGPGLLEIVRLSTAPERPASTP